LLEGVVGRANQWSRFDVFEAHLLAKALEFSEFVRVDALPGKKAG
jgi:hypothetical protein